LEALAIRRATPAVVDANEGAEEQERSDEDGHHTE